VARRAPVAGYRDRRGRGLAADRLAPAAAADASATGGGVRGGGDGAVAARLGARPRARRGVGPGGQPARLPLPPVELLGHRRARSGHGPRGRAPRGRRGASPDRARGRRAARAHDGRQPPRRDGVDPGARRDGHAARGRRDRARLHGTPALRGRQAGAGRAAVGHGLGRGSAAPLGGARGPRRHAARGSRRAAARGPPGAPVARRSGLRGGRAAARLRVGAGLGDLRAAAGSRRPPRRRHARAATRAARARALRRALATGAAGAAARRRARRLPRVEPRAARASRSARRHRRGEIGHDPGLWAGLFGGAALASLWPVDPWALSLLALGGAGSALGPAALWPPRRGRTATTAGVFGLLVFASFAAAQVRGSSGGFLGAAIAYPALVAAPAGAAILWLGRRLAR